MVVLVKDKFLPRRNGKEQPRYLTTAENNTEFMEACKLYCGIDVNTQNNLGKAALMMATRLLPRLILIWPIMTALHYLCEDTELLLTHPDINVNAIVYGM